MTHLFGIPKIFCLNKTKKDDSIKKVINAVKVITMIRLKIKVALYSLSLLKKFLEITECEFIPINGNPNAMKT